MANKMFRDSTTAERIEAALGSTKKPKVKKAKDMSSKGMKGAMKTVAEANAPRRTFKQLKKSLKSK